MVRYISEKQLTIEEFKTPFRANLSAENRWVKLARVVPWDKFASIYMTLMSSDLGRPGVSPRTVLGALIIKHLEKLDDRGVIQAIQENLYMQYLININTSFTSKYQHIVYILGRPKYQNIVDK